MTVSDREIDRWAIAENSSFPIHIMNSMRDQRTLRQKKPVKEYEDFTQLLSTSSHKRLRRPAFKQTHPSLGEHAKLHRKFGIAVVLNDIAHFHSASQVVPLCWNHTKSFAVPLLGGIPP